MCFIARGTGYNTNTCLRSTYDYYREEALHKHAAAEARAAGGKTPPSEYHTYLHHDALPEQPGGLHAPHPEAKAVQFEETREMAARGEAAAADAEAAGRRAAAEKEQRKRGKAERAEARLGPGRVRAGTHPRAVPARAGKERTPKRRHKPNLTPMRVARMAAGPEEAAGVAQARAAIEHLHTAARDGDATEVPAPRLSRPLLWLGTGRIPTKLLRAIRRALPALPLCPATVQFHAVTRW